jgi:hypothetical protein
MLLVRLILRSTRIVDVDTACLHGALLEHVNVNISLVMQHELKFCLIFIWILYESLSMDLLQTSQTYSF